MNAENKNTPQVPGQYRPNLCFYRANARGTGSALKMSLHPAHDNVDGCVMATIANQMTVGNPMGPNPTFAKFDWENAMCVKLDFGDLCQMLQVFRGECESINGDHGLWHRTAQGNTKIVLRHLIDPVPGYTFEVFFTPADGSEERRWLVLLQPSEALGISEVISGSMCYVAFGVPEVPKAAVAD